MAVPGHTVDAGSDGRRAAPRRRMHPEAYAYLSPALLTMAVFSLYPVAWTVYLGFTNYSLYRFNEYDFIGFRNFQEIVFGPLRGVFWSVFLWTVTYAAGTVFLSFVIGLVLAVLLNNAHLRERNLYRGILIIPWALPATIAILAWSGMLNESYGPINLFLQRVGLPPLPFLTHPGWARAAIITVNVWLSYPFMMSACIGGLQSIPPELYEVAELDGAGWWQRFRYITLPSLARFSVPLLISSFAFNFNNFGPAFLITGGGPPIIGNIYAGSTDILVSTVYKLTVILHRYGLASAMSMVLFLIVAALSLVNMRLTGAFQEAD